MATGKTAKSILISCGARLAPFDIKELRDLTEYDEMELDALGDEKTAMFVIISDTDDTFNFLVAIMYTQLFNLLCDKADDFYGGRLPVHVRFILDEFSNIGQIPKFGKLIATIRSREISASIILQAQSQLKATYKDNTETTAVISNTLFFIKLTRFHFVRTDSELSEPDEYLVKNARVQLVVDEILLLVLDDHIRFFQQFQMIGQGSGGYTEVFCYLTGIFSSVTQHCDNIPPLVIGQNFECF